jgi:hypothetical protein
LLVTLSTVHLSGWNFIHHSFSQCPSLSRSFCSFSIGVVEYCQVRHCVYLWIWCSQCRLPRVPQGSVLDSGLFLYYINDLQSRLTSTVRLFADDTIAYLTISNNNDAETLCMFKIKFCHQFCDFEKEAKLLVKCKVNFAFFHFKS